MDFVSRDSDWFAVIWLLQCQIETNNYCCYLLIKPFQQMNGHGRHIFHCVKSVRIRSYSGPHFPAFGLNTERYSVFSPNAGKCRPKRTLFTQYLWFRPKHFFSNNKAKSTFMLLLPFEVLITLISSVSSNFFIRHFQYLWNNYIWKTVWYLWYFYNYYNYHNFMILFNYSATRSVLCTWWSCMMWHRCNKTFCNSIVDYAT